MFSIIIITFLFAILQEKNYGVTVTKRFKRLFSRYDIRFITALYTGVDSKLSWNANDDYSTNEYKYQQANVIRTSW